jgi:hypothetical protein
MADKRADTRKRRACSYADKQAEGSRDSEQAGSGASATLFKSRATR